MGAEGFVIDHYDGQVVDKFLKTVAEPELKACGPNPPYAVFCDSLEVAGEDWTGNFLAEFQKRRGYDLRPYLPALAGDDNDRNKDIRHDWGQTLTELFIHHFLTPLERWSKEHATRLRIQGYGSPPAALYCYAYADLNEAEGHLWKEFEESRWAASASHLLGRPVTSSETWTWLHSPVFRATPLDMKAEADLHFLQGINQLIGHGWPYTPPGVASSRLAVLRRGRVQRTEPVVDRHARSGPLPPAGELSPAPGAAGQRRCPLLVRTAMPGHGSPPAASA